MQIDLGALSALLLVLLGAGGLLFAIGFALSALREREEEAAIPGQPRPPARGGSAAQRRLAREAAAGRRRRWLSGPVLGAVVGAAGSLALVLWLAPPLLLLHHHDLPFERLYGNAAVTLAARLGGAGNPANPTRGSPKVLSAGRDAYTGSCAACHGDKGDGRGVWGQASYPPATDLTAQTVRVKTDAQLFWIVKNGLSFAGMPAYGGQYSDENMWFLVGYIRALQQRQGSPPAVPTPTAEQLAMADPLGDAVQRGATVWFAQGCHFCHGAMGDAPGNLELRGSGDISKPVREGDEDGMPFYSADRITDAELADLAAYFQTFAEQQGLQPGR